MGDKSDVGEHERSYVSSELSTKSSSKPENSVSLLFCDEEYVSIEDSSLLLLLELLEKMVFFKLEE